MKMKKALVIGGSNGIGLAIVNCLIESGYYVYILDISKPDSQISSVTGWEYEFCDLTELDECVLMKYVQNKSISFVMVTAGIGRVADFQYLSTIEIEKIMLINATATIKLVRLFYDRLKTSQEFHIGIVGSIAGLVSSPMFSVYAASKAAICRFVESVNIELEMSGTQNRITNICPGSIQGTKFNGGKNDLEKTLKIAKEIIEQILSNTELYIPDENGVYHNVIQRYKEDAHAFGVSSYQYKKESGRTENTKKLKIGYLSGTFDLFHIGHLNLLRRAKKYCDYLIVGVHLDASHKGKETFIPFEERKEIVGSCKYVDCVVQSDQEDVDAWGKYHYNYLFVGSDYKGTERFKKYEKYFEDKNVEIIYFPYTQSTSSTQIRETILGIEK